MTDFAISVEVKKCIIEKLKLDLIKFWKRYKKMDLKEDDYYHLTLFISVLIKTNLNIFNEKKLEEMLEFFLEKFREKIYSGKYEDFFCSGLYTGVGTLVFSLEILENKGIYLHGFSEFFQEFLLQSVDYYLSKKKFQTRIYNYDLLYGVSGVLYYYLDHGEQHELIIRKMIRYLIYLTRNKMYKGVQIINFHIEPQKQISEHEKQKFPEGHIDFGMAHGMISCLIALAKAKYKRYNIGGIDDAIKKIVKIYERFSVSEENDGLLFPKRISPREWKLGRYNEISENAGWCYGNAGILRGLMKVMYYLKDRKKYIYYKEELIKVINCNQEKYHLDTPVLCHGYASILLIQVSAYRESGDVRFLKYLERNIRILLSNEAEYITKEKQYKKSCDILNGPLGIDLTFLDILNIATEYEKIMMID